LLLSLLLLLLLLGEVEDVVEVAVVVAVEEDAAVSVLLFRLDLLEKGLLVVQRR
jgi:hypothetical protein